MEKKELEESLAAVYAALILHDDGHRITAAKLNKVLSAANITIAPYWGALFEHVCRDRDLDQLLDNLSQPPVLREQPKERIIPYIKEHKFRKTSDPETSDFEASGLFDD